MPLAGNFLVTSVDFTDADSAGRRISAIRAGDVDYPTLSRSSRRLEAGEFLAVESLTDFYVTRIEVKPEGLELHLHGQAEQLNVGAAGAIESQLPSRLETWSSRSPWSLYGGAVLAIGALVAGVAALRWRAPRR